MRQSAVTHRLAARESEANPETAARLSISLVGRPTMMFAGRLVELRTQKASAVLSYLALTEAKHESRERLVGLLWSRSDEERARASLRQVVRELRTAFEDAGYGGFSAGRLRSISAPRRSRWISKASSGWRKAAASIPCCSIPRSRRADSRGHGRPRSVIPDLGSCEASNHQ